MAEKVFLQIGSINVDSYLLPGIRMQKEFRRAILSFQDKKSPSAPLHPSPPDLLAICEVPSDRQCENLRTIASDIALQHGSFEYHFEWKQVSNNNFLALLWNSSRFELAQDQPATASTRFLPVALRSLETDRVHLCAAIHGETTTQVQVPALEALHQCAENFGLHDHFHIFGCWNCRPDVIRTHFDDSTFIVSLSEEDPPTTRNGTRCDNIVWDRGMNFDSAYVVDVLDGEFSHLPIQSFASCQP